MSMYKQFQTDPSIEQKGVILDYGTFRVTVARAGGGNKRYAAVLEARSKPFRRAIQTETISPERASAILRETYAEAVVQRWDVNVGTEKEPQWKEGIEGPNGDLLPPTKENIIQAFASLPDLFEDIQVQAQRVALYRAAVQEADSGN